LTFASWLLSNFSKACEAGFERSLYISINY
jgi:hypothetical protein